MHWKKVLFLAPHTDDAELGCGGTIARMMEEKVQVHVAAFSTAEESRPPGSEPFILKKEFLESMRLLDIPPENVYVYDYPVRRLSYHRQEVLEELVRLRRVIQPEAVFVPSGSDLHQDHQTLYTEGLRAFKDINLLGYELPWNHISFSAQAFVTLESRHIEKKWQALTAYESQLKLQRGYFNQEMMESLARVRGVQVKSAYAEAFEVLRVKW